MTVQGSAAVSGAAAPVVITEVAAQRGGTVGNSVNFVDYIFPVDVTAGDLVLVGCSKFGVGAFAAADCAQIAGTAALEAFSLDSSISNGDKHSGVFSARVSVSGSLTVRVAFPGGPAFPTVGCSEFISSSGWGAAGVRIEDVSSAFANASAAVDSGAASSVGPALFFGTCEVSNGFPASLTLDPAFTEVFQNIVVAGGFGGQGFRIAAGALTDSISWTIDIPMDWTAALAVYKGQ